MNAVANPLPSWQVANLLYDHDGIQILHGDCGAMALPEVDIVLTDPPYGIGSWSATGGNSIRADEVEEINEWDKEPVGGDVLLRAVAAGKRAVVWGGNYLMDVLGRCRAPLVWDKAIRGMHFADGEMAWTNFDYGTLRILNFNLAAGDTKGRRLHPTQKPLQVMGWSLAMAKAEPGMTVLDPFMGSGTTLIAARDRGLKAIGIDISGEYCQTAIERLRQGILLNV